MTTISDSRAARLELEPLRTTGPKPGFARGLFGQVADIWRHRELLDMLIRRELKARYKDSALGFVWSLMRPLAMLLIYYVALGKFLGAARAIPDFAIFIYTGLTAWGLFSEAVSTGTSSIVGNSGLIKKVYLPREIFPLAAMGSALFNFAIQLVILFAATILVGDMPTGARWGYLPLALAVIVVTALGWSLLLSAVNVYLRDITYLVEIGIMIFFWASPIAYAWSMVNNQVDSEILKQLYLMNPMTVAIMGFQKTFWVAADGGPIPPGATPEQAALLTPQPWPDHLELRLWIWLAVGLVLTLIGQRVFARLQGNFAQEL
ncbi:ABC transporter permease [Cellulomonas sp. C5510]|uniref:ABC transporter permease n=1 Tax=Cellulomonas sp. C5510 TaxID=2871170 RepID=UPI001C982BA8|nr:ABC transporter permease [Cellulomonas sp. C5510]QZN84800.1 ABC transporter permease [Cellulomonas sp. C5510]